MFAHILTPRSLVTTPAMRTNIAGFTNRKGTTMTNMYKCPCCGGNVNTATMRCEYCGTMFEQRNNNLLRIETYRNPVRTLRGAVVIPSHEVRYLGPEETSKLAMSRLQSKMAEAIADVMSYTVEYDLDHLDYRIYGEMRAVVPVHNGVEDMVRGLS